MGWYDEYSAIRQNNLIYPCIWNVDPNECDEDYDSICTKVNSIDNEGNFEYVVEQYNLSSKMTMYFYIGAGNRYLKPSSGD